MISNVEKGKIFQNYCQKILKAEFGRDIESEVRFTLTDGRSHKFDLATSDRAIVAECKAYTWTSGGNIPSAKITHLKESVDYLNNLPPSIKALLLIKRDPHPVRRETIGSYFVRLNKEILKNVNVIEVSETKNEIEYLHKSYQA